MIAIFPVLFAACSSSSSSSPTGVVNAFIEASKKGDVDGVKKYITQQDLQLLEPGEKAMAMFDSTKKNSIKEKMAEKFKENTKDAKIDVGNEKIDGDNATVEVTHTNEGKPETIPFALKKENGEWKISLVSTGMKASGMTQEQANEKLKEATDAINNMGNIKDSVAKAMEQLKGINTDSLKMIMNEAKDKLEKMKAASEKTAH